MAWRTVVVANPAKLKIESDQLCIVQDSTAVLPVQDIAVLLVESQEVTITAPALCRLAETGAVVIFCDRRHMPVFVGHSYAAHSRLSGMHKIQLATTLPFRKRCWQSVVQQKLKNQAACLKYKGIQQAASIYELVDSVKSGDTDNAEANGSRIYFPLLFGRYFLRSGVEYLNSALDYGYAVLRGAVVRSLAAHGFLLTQGIHHCSELNPFNLADDFIEPFRPAVDLMVSDMHFGEDGFCADHRAQLVSVLTMDMLVGNARQSVLRAADICAASFVTACKAGDSSVLKLPALIPLSEHRYE